MHRNEAEEEGTGNSDAEEFAVYPNPVTNTLTIDIPVQDTEVTIDIIDFTGKRIFSLISDNSQVKLNTSSWKTGIYVLHVSDKKGRKLWQTKIVKF